MSRARVSTTKYHFPVVELFSRYRKCVLTTITAHKKRCTYLRFKNEKHMFWISDYFSDVRSQCCSPAQYITRWHVYTYTNTYYYDAHRTKTHKSIIIITEGFKKKLYIYVNRLIRYIYISYFAFISTMYKLRVYRVRNIRSFDHFWVNIKLKNIFSLNTIFNSWY